MTNLSSEYSKRIEYIEKLVKKYNRVIDTISTLRLVVFLLSAAVGVYFYIHKNNTALVIDCVLFGAVFLTMVIMHQKYIDKKEYYSALLHINIYSQKRANGEWKEFEDTGSEFEDENHSYSQDLDIFGEGSLFQWINTTKTFTGRQSLKNLLTAPDKTRDKIIKRQKAVDELAQSLDFRQDMEVQGLLSKGKMMDLMELEQWANSVHTFYRRPSVVFVFSLLPLITIVTGLLYILFRALPENISVLLLILQFLLLGLFKMGERNKILETAYKYSDSIKLYANMLQKFEMQSFKSELLTELQQKLLSKDGTHAHQQIKKLDSIVDYISNRHAMLYIIFDALFLLDYHFVFALEKWKQHSGKNIKLWFDVLGEAEALCSLSIIKFDNPGWCFPEISEKSQVFTADKMGHPLIGRDCVLNSISFKPPISVLMITGSNMSGKSTFLRTAGINLVLSYAGAPVYASKLCCSIMDIYTCMRISDNLEKNISSFYAELLRIKNIVEAVDNERSVFFLLDEIFKGTNSKDRHTGASMLIKKLCNKNAIGFVSTHDIELSELEKTSPKIKNNHFEEHYVNDSICFDYKLLPGVSTTRNAIYLMKLVGIKTDE